MVKLGELNVGSDAVYAVEGVVEAVPPKTDYLGDVNRNGLGRYCRINSQYRLKVLQVCIRAGAASRGQPFEVEAQDTIVNVFRRGLEAKNLII